MPLTIVSKCGERGKSTAERPGSTQRWWDCGRGRHSRWQLPWEASSERGGWRAGGLVGREKRAESSVKRSIVEVPSLHSLHQLPTPPLRSDSVASPEWCRQAHPSDGSVEAVWVHDPPTWACAARTGGLGYRARTGGAADPAASNRVSHRTARYSMYRMCGHRIAQPTYPIIHVASDGIPKDLYVFEHSVMLSLASLPSSCSRSLKYMLVDSCQEQADLASAGSLRRYRRDLGKIRVPDVSENRCSSLWRAPPRPVRGGETPHPA